MVTQQDLHDTESDTAGKENIAGKKMERGEERREVSPVHCDTTERSPLPTVYFDGQTHIVRYVNPAFCRLVGEEAEELIGRPFAQAVPEGETNGCLALLARVYHTGTTETLADQEHTPSSLLRSSFSGSSHPGVYWSYVAWAVHDVQERLVGVMMQVSDTSATQYAREQATLISEALLLYGLTQNESAEGLRTREQAVVLNEALYASLVAQNELMTGLNTRLQVAMRETHHRVKNNLQIVSALAEVQMDGESDTVPIAALQRIAAHVRTLAGLHDLLTRQVKEDAIATTLNTGDALGNLLPLLQVSIGTRRIRSEIAEVLLPIKLTASLSLLVSELVSNAVKHGQGDITVRLECKEDENAVHLTVPDAGQGFPERFDPRKAANTGLDLILSLARHDLRGEITFANRSEGGAEVMVYFPMSGGAEL